MIRGGYREGIGWGHHVACLDCVYVYGILCMHVVYTQTNVAMYAYVSQRYTHIQI